MSDARQILDFWLTETGEKGWYLASGEIDNRIRAGFHDLWQRARTGACHHWQSSADTTLALLILLDQFPRNMFRGSGDAFATDALARGVAKLAIARGADRAVPEPERQFFYLPFMHAESITEQHRCIRLLQLYMPRDGDKNIEHAIKHRNVIRRFGRFPSRNAALGRADTDAERAYRAAGGYMS